MEYMSTCCFYLPKKIGRFIIKSRSVSSPKVDHMIQIERLEIYITEVSAISNASIEATRFCMALWGFPLSLDTAHQPALLVIFVVNTCK